MATERIVIEVSEKGTRVVKRGIDDLGRSAKDAGGAVDLLKKALGLIGVGLAVAELRRAADAYTNIQNRVRLYTSSQEELLAVQTELFRISQQTRTSFTGNANLYGRLAAATKDLGATQQDVLTLTKQLNQAIAISGATSEEGSAALLQLGQALSAGALQGDEFRSVNESLPKVMEIVAKSLGVTRGQLKAMAGEGKLTATVILDAFRKFGPELEAEFAGIRPTMSQAFAVLDNAFVNFVGGVDQATGVSATFAEILIAVANNFDKVALAAVALGGAAALGFVVTQLAALGGAFAFLGSTALSALGLMFTAVKNLVTVFGLLNLAVLTNPLFLAGAALVGGAVAAFFLLGGTVDDVVGAFQGLGRVANLAIGALVGGVKTIVDAWRLLPGAIADLAIQAVNFLIEKFEAGVNKVVGLLNVLPGVHIGEVALGQFENDFAGKASEVGRIAAHNMADAFARDWLKEGADKAKLLADFFKRLANPSTAGDLTKGIKGGSNSALTPTLTQQETQKLDALLKKLDPVGAATKDVAEGTDLLNKALAAGKITAAQHALAIGRLSEVYEDQLDPLGAVNRELDKERKLLGMTSEAREVESRALDIEKTLKDAGVKLTKAQSEALRGELTSLQQLNDQREREESLYKAIRGPQEDYTKNQAALNKLLDEGRISAAEFETQARKLRIAFLDTQTDASSGVERTFLKLEDTVADTASSVEKLLTDAFKAAEDAVVEFAHTGEFEVGDFFRMIGDELLRLGTRQAILALGNGLGFNGGGGTGGTGFDIGGMVAKGIGSLFGGGGLGSLFGFANGGDFTVGAKTGAPINGVDNRLVAFRARDGERVTVTPPNGQAPSGRPIQVMFNVTTPDADSFRRSQGQIMARTAAALNRANSRNN